MTTGKKTVAVITTDREVPPDVAAPLTRGGFAVAAFPFTATLPTDTAAVLVLVDGTPDATVAFTRRRRVDAPSPRPILWLFAPDAAHAAPTGFDAGADVCLLRPVDADVLVAQVNALLRTYSELSRVVAKGGEAVELSERLGKHFRQTDADTALARRTLVAFAPTPPVASAGVEADWVCVPPSRGGVCTCDVIVVGDGLRFVLLTVGGMGVTTGAALAEALARFLSRPGASPSVALTDANRRVRQLGLPDTAMLAATVGHLHGGGKVVVACGGHPPPVLVPTVGMAKLWHGVGAFLGQSEAGYSDLTGDLQPGERLLLLAGGAAADKRPDVRAAVADHSGKPLGEFVRGVSGAVFTPADADDGYTLVSVGRTANSSGTIAALTEPE